MQPFFDFYVIYLYITYSYSFASALRVADTKSIVAAAAKKKNNYNDP